MNRPTVAIAKTGDRPNPDQVGVAVRQAVALAGGLEGVVSRGDLVLIKPNLVATPPSADAGACTSASVCIALANFKGTTVIAPRYSLMFAGSTLATLPLLIIFFAFQKQLISGIMSGAIKGGG